MKKIDHISEITALSIEVAAEVRSGKLGADKGKVIASNVGNAVRGIHVELISQQDRYKSHSVTWLRKLKPDTSVESNSVKKGKV